ncbi:MAG: hypothetical protein KA603_08175 [Azonexus sp.]|nr:hypothetical protein [Betaproteobacteria bacterium]MBK8916949.1 hypothetical protein [Betaproteobacteria bacterium]MBP6036094.1 hypothetical protein [Azonexus sp.]MBP6906617.1 hypothetical protein [Azonexus sp.]
MTFTSADLKKLRWHLAGVALLLLAGLFLASQSRALRQHAGNARQAAEAAAREAENRLRRVRIEENEIRDKSLTLAAMQKRGTLGSEQRLAWTETLRDAQRRHKLPEISYEFGPRAALAPAAAEAVRFYASPMKLRLRLVHEEDLLRYLDTLRREASALVVVRACTLKRGAPLGSAPAPEAACDLDWVTAQAGNPGEEKRP